MSVIKSVFLFILMSVVPSLILYLLFDGLVFRLMMIVFILGWGAVYLYLDKFLLMHIKGREVVDTDQQFLFQCIKNETYKSSVKIPKVYLYSGEALKCFVFQSRNEWSLVFDRRLLGIMDEAQLKSMISFLYRFRTCSICLVQTKVLGICALFFSFVYWFLKNALFLQEDSKLFRTLSIFIFGMMRPLLLPLEVLGRKQKKIIADLALVSIYNQAAAQPFTYNEYVMSHLLPNLKTRNLTVNYLEGFPVLENCRFYEKEI